MTSKSTPGDGDPFSDLKLASFTLLKELQGRSRCTVCEASRKFFCYTCCRPVKELEGKLPHVELPIEIDIIKHSLEVDGKSTAVHACILAPEQVHLYTYPCIPEYKEPSKVLLVYPSETARTLKELLPEKEKDDGNQSQNGNDLPTARRRRALDGADSNTPFERVVFIDSTWSQSRKMFADERLRDLPCVVLTERKTYFWRTQDKEETYLATIEAVYYFLTELHESTSDLPYDGRYDNLMYFFVYMFRIIAESKQKASIKVKARGAKKAKCEANVT